MRKRQSALVMAVVLVAGYVSLAAGAPRASTAAARTVTGSAPASVALAWNGLWRRQGDRATPEPERILPFLNATQRGAFSAAIAAHSFHVPWSFCEPAAVPGMMTDAPPTGFEFFFKPDRVTVLTSTGEYRHIYTDGRAHPNKDLLFPSYYGHSIGHWEGDSLVVDTVALRDDNHIVMGLPAPNMHVVERIRLTGAGRLENQVTITGPSFLQRPFVQTYRYVDAKADPPEAICVPSSNFNNGEEFNLTPPPAASGQP